MEVFDCRPEAADETKGCGSVLEHQVSGELESRSAGGAKNAMKKTKRKLVKTAYHEAAHAIVLYRTAGHVGGHVTIVPCQEENWIALGAACDLISDSLSPEDMEAWILSCYAGGHAQRELEPGWGTEGCGRDDALADEQLRRHGWEDREQQLREQSLALTRKHWSEIVAVADELLRLRVLDETEVEIISDAAAGDPDALLDLARYRALYGDEVEEWRKRARMKKRSDMRRQSSDKRQR